MKGNSRALVLCIALAGCGYLPGTTAPAPLRAKRARAAFRRAADSLLSMPEFRSATWGVLVVDPAAHDTIYAHMPSNLFLPASNMKLATASTALEQLGPDYRFRTTIAARGSVTDGTLVGDLVVEGRGDPTISDHMRQNAMTPLLDIADSLRARGIRRITGRVLTEGDAFPGPARGFGWPWDQLDDSDFAGVDELLFNEGFSLLHVRGGPHAGDLAQVTTSPARTYPRVHASAVTVDRPTSADGAAMSSLQVRSDSAGGAEVTGWITAGDTVTLALSQRDPDTAYMAAFREALLDRSVQVDGAVTEPAPRLDTLITVLSPPLAEIMPALMKPSQNQIAEVLLRTVGLERAGAGTADSGRKVVERELVSFGATPDGYMVRDGSGLSRYDYLSPETVVRILDGMRRSRNFQLFYSSLPIAGVDGTIRTRMRGTAAQGNVHAKTGTLTGARSLSGYVTTADGRLLEFSMLCNNWMVPVREVNRVQDALAVALAELRLQ